MSSPATRELAVGVPSLLNRAVTQVDQKPSQPRSRRRLQRVAEGAHGTFIRRFRWLAEVCHDYVSITLCHFGRGRFDCRIEMSVAES